MKKYNQINNLTGWLAFAVAAITYLMTIEETGSFWDCGEFIAAAYKLQVGHPPGAALFLLIGRIFTMFSFGDVNQVAIMVNGMSALSSAITILFLFWSITHIARKLIKVTDAELSTANYIGIMGSGLVGALAYTFSDSFWFSAVEGEVYAMSSMFTAIVFWAMLKWEHHADEKHSDKWLVLIAYLMGLSIGVHLLNLLTIPALAYIYYFRRYKPTKQGLIITALAGVAILGFVQYGIIQGFVKIGAHFDLLFVNTFGLPFWSGFLFFVALLVFGIYMGIRYSIRTSNYNLNTAFLCFAFIVLGYASYGQVVIRSMANPPMDENNPENAFALLSYLNREQYGDRPLFYGQHYSAKMVDQKEGSATYAELDGKYKKTGNKIEPVYDPTASTLFPRMHSNQDNHVAAYKEWMNIRSDRNPTMGENLGFFFSYQLGHMFWRYFLWNFAGRQNDIQGHGGSIKGNWISGIKALDEGRIGPMDDYPQSLGNNKAMNKFYMLPLILGLIGMFFHFYKSKYDGSVVMLLFFFTGIAIVIYLNQTPYQPRERDYAYAGSFYAFAIWIGLGVMALANFISKKLPAVVAGSTALTVSLVAVPFVMAKEGWDDHDRSHRFTSRDFAHNYLNSCSPNAIIFTNGDNDTFPLWYAQEVEGVRTDVRVVNLSLLNTDWYIEQMHHKAYDSDPVPFSLTYDKVIQGTRDYVPFYDRNIQGYANLKDVITLIGSDDPKFKAMTQGGELINFYPTKKFSIPVDSAKVVANGTVPKEMASRIVKNLEFEVDGNYLMKADIMILDLLAHNNWERPVYFAITVGSDSYLNLEDYFQLEGMAYRLVPVRNDRNPDGQIGSVNSNEMFNKMVNLFKWGNMSNPHVYLDQNNLNMTMNLRNNFGRLAEALLAEGKRDSAMTALDKCLEVMPDKTVPYNIMMIRVAEMYYAVANFGSTPARAAIKDPQDPNKILMPAVEATPASPYKRSQEAIAKADSIMNRLGAIYENDFKYYASLAKTKYFDGVQDDAGQCLAVFRELERIANRYGRPEIAASMKKRFEESEGRVFINR
ncbi:MAG: protein O-mannosyl-transferase family [Bacteroidota bacterium]|jgi:tetratricopeptide (TPR) repeat protein/MFS family permease